MFSGNAKTNILKKTIFNLTQLLQKIRRKLLYLESICYVLHTDQFCNNIFFHTFVKQNDKNKEI